MPHTDPYDIAIDPLTGNVPLGEGTAVVIEDDFGCKHRGFITYVRGEVDPQFTVLIACKSGEREVTIPESQILARVAGGYEG